MKQNFLNKYGMIILLFLVSLVCMIIVLNTAITKKYSKSIEVVERTVAKKVIGEEKITIIDELEYEVIIQDKNNGEPVPEETEEKEEVIKKEDGNVTFKGVTVEVPEVKVASVNDNEDKQKAVQAKDSSTSNAPVVTQEQTLEKIELFERTGNYVGIDVSKWQGNIDWKTVKESGIEFAMLRIGYRGSQYGNIVMDPYFKQNVNGAVSNGIKVGVYFFSMARNEEEAIQEAAWTVENAGKYKITYPIAYDFESWGVGRVSDVPDEQFHKNALAFLSYVKASGFSGMMYGSKSSLYNKFNMSAYSSYKIWLAHYTEKTNYGGRYNMWQYTDKGRVPGINEPVDMNVSYFGYSKEKEPVKPETKVENTTNTVNTTNTINTTNVVNTNVTNTNVTNTNVSNNNAINNTTTNVSNNTSNTPNNTNNINSTNNSNVNNNTANTNVNGNNTANTNVNGNNNSNTNINTNTNVNSNTDSNTNTNQNTNTNNSVSNENTANENNKVDTNTTSPENSKPKEEATEEKPAEKEEEKTSSNDSNEKDNDEKKENITTESEETNTVNDSESE